MGVKSPRVGLDEKQINNRFRKIERLLEQLQNGGTSTPKEKAQTHDEFVESILTGGVDQVENTPKAVMNDQGEMELYDPRTGERVDIKIPPTGWIHGTRAGQTVPSSFYLDLRLHNNDEHARHITADWLTLHDNSTHWKTVGIANVDEVNQNGTAGPIAGGRDRAAVFDREWVYLYIIYNSNTQDVSSLMSASSTAPTLPTGYDYFVRVGSCWVDVSSHNTTGAQYGDRTLQYTQGLNNGNPDAADAWQTLVLDTLIPPTAKAIFGYFGLTSDPLANPAMGVSTFITATPGFSLDDYCVYATLSIAGGYGTLGALTRMKSATYFELPIRVQQTMYWIVDIDAARYGITINGWIDDL